MYFTYKILLHTIWSNYYLGYTHTHVFIHYDVMHNWYECIILLWYNIVSCCTFLILLNFKVYQNYFNGYLFLCILYIFFWEKYIINYHLNFCQIVLYQFVLNFYIRTHLYCVYWCPYFMTLLFFFFYKLMFYKYVLNVYFSMAYKYSLLFFL